MSLDKDSLPNTFIVATLLCLVCSFLVSAAAVGLKPIKTRNIQLDRKNNLLQVTGFSPKDIKEAGGIEELFANRFEATIINLDTGEEASEDCKAALDGIGKKLGDIVGEYDQLWASKSKNEAISKRLDKKADVAGVKYREQFSHVFVLKSEDGKVEKYVFPVRGMGLWSLMQGYLAVEPDFQTVTGITFYDQAETPGLGGEVMNPKWKALWDGKQIYVDGNVALKVSKGDQTENPNGVDGLSGATITSNGVSNMLEYWLGSDGFGPFIEKQKSGSNSSASVDGLSKAGVSNG